MTATSLNRYIWRAIGEFSCHPKELTRAACASKGWKAQIYTHIFGAFLTSYAQEPILAERMALFAHLPNEAARIGALFKTVVKDGTVCWVQPTRTLYPPTLLAYYQELRAISLVNFLKRLAEEISEAKTFLGTLDEKDPQITEKIKAWLHENKPLLEKQEILTVCGKYPIYVMPDEIELFSGATHLKCGFVNLIALSSSIGSLENLVRLNLNNSHLVHLPPSICRLSKLEAFSIPHNWRLTSLPENWGELRALTHLNLSENALTSLPNSICQLTSLQTLNLWRNQLSQLPADIGNLSELTSLNVEENALTSLPDSICKLTKLVTLAIQVNQLTTLPETLLSLTQLEQFSFGGNPIEAIPAAFKTCEIAAIRDNRFIRVAKVAERAPPAITLPEQPQAAPVAAPPTPELTLPPPAPSPSLWEQAEEQFWSYLFCIKEAIASLLRLLFHRA